MSNNANVQDYLELVRAEDMEGSAAYLSEHFGDVNSGIETKAKQAQEELEAFMAEVMAAAEVQVAEMDKKDAEIVEAMDEIIAEHEGTSDEAVSADVSGSEDTSTNVEVQEVTSES